MYNSSRTGNHRSLRPGRGVPGRSSGVHQRLSDSDLRARREKLQRSLRRRNRLNRIALQSARCLHSPAALHEFCLWCGSEFSGCETLPFLLRGPDALCPQCAALRETANIDIRKKGRRLRILYYRNSECDRILRRILQNGDLEAASGFLDGHEDELSALCRRPVRVAEAEACSTQVFEAFFGRRALLWQNRLAQKRRLKTGRRKQPSTFYTALSYTGLSYAQIEEILEDNDCREIWILMQKKEDADRKHLKRCLKR